MATENNREEVFSMTDSNAQPYAVHLQNNVSYYTKDATTAGEDAQQITVTDSTVVVHLEDHIREIPYHRVKYIKRAYPEPIEPEQA